MQNFTITSKKKMQVFIGQHQVLRTHKVIAIARQTFRENSTRKPFTNKTKIGD